MLSKEFVKTNLSSRAESSTQPYMQNLALLAVPPPKAAEVVFGASGLPGLGSAVPYGQTLPPVRQQHAEAARKFATISTLPCNLLLSQPQPLLPPGERDRL